MNETKTHSIKLSDPVYLRLDRLRGKGQTFSKAVDVLCEVSERVLSMAGEQGLTLGHIKRERLEEVGNAGDHS